MESRDFQSAPPPPPPRAPPRPPRRVSRPSTLPPPTPITAGATFTITPLDVGSDAVRPGCMADLEQQHALLLIAGRAVLKRIQARKIEVGAVFEYALERAIQICETPK